MLYFAKTASVRLIPLAGAEQDVPVASLRKIVFTADSIVFVPVATAPTEGELSRVVYKYDYRTMLFVATEPIIDNGNGNYTVPANAEVTILATPNEGYEFTGWRAGNLDEMVGCYYCGTALSTNDNPMTFTMTGAQVK